VGPRRRKQNGPESPNNRAPQLEPPASPAKGVSAAAEGPAPPTLIAVPIDPYVIHCQWDLVPADIESAKRALGVNEHEYWPVLQLYDLSYAGHDEVVVHPSFSVEVQLTAENWFVRSCSPDHAYCAELVLKREDGSFAVVARSSPVHTPPSAPSNYVDDHWAPIRLQHRKPESATPVLPPFDLAVQSASGPPAESPTDFGRLPIDRREEVKNLLSQLYGELGGKRSAIPGPHLTVDRTFAEGVVREILGPLEARLGVTTDLTELNERSFTSGISSRTT
jgi:hypothetical protein